MEALLHSLLHLTVNSKKQTTCMNQTQMNQHYAFTNVSNSPQKGLPEMIVTCMQMPPSSGKNIPVQLKIMVQGYRPSCLCHWQEWRLSTSNFFLNAPDQQMDTIMCIVSFQSVNANKLIRSLSLIKTILERPHMYSKIFPFKTACLFKLLTFYENN